MHVSAKTLTVIHQMEAFERGYDGSDATPDGEPMELLATDLWRLQLGTPDGRVIMERKSCDVAN